MVVNIWGMKITVKNLFKWDKGGIELGCVILFQQYLYENFSISAAFIIVDDMLFDFTLKIEEKLFS